LAATIREIREGLFPHLPTIAGALRGGEPVPEEVRIFLAQLIERDRIRKIKRPKSGRPKAKLADATREISDGKSPDLRTIAKDLREKEEVSKVVRILFAELIDEKRIMYPGRGTPRAKNIIEQHVIADIVRATFEDERDEIRKIPKAQRLESPTEVACPRTAKTLAKKGMVGKTGKPLSDRTIKRRAKRPGG
jgi:hypothetical protein